jgi:hypothetical protein
VFGQAECESDFIFVDQFDRVIKYLEYDKIFQVVIINVIQTEIKPVDIDTDGDRYVVIQPGLKYRKIGIAFDIQLAFIGIKQSVAECDGVFTVFERGEAFFTPLCPKT